MSSKRWTAEQIGDKSGLVAVVTGASAGLGRITALELARHGAWVVLAVRNRAKGDQTASWINVQVPGAKVEVRQLDLAGLRSVRDFAAGMHNDFDRVDLLIHNAGVMRTPPGWTEDGFETQMAVNHLGPFALTGLLYPLLTAAGPARVVTVSSTEHKPGVINFDDLRSRQDYHPRRAYQQSKLAVTTFALELDRRLRQAGSKVARIARGHKTVIALSCFPLTATEPGQLHPATLAQQRTAKTVLDNLRGEGSHIAIIEPDPEFLAISAAGRELMNTSRLGDAYFAGTRLGARSAHRIAALHG